jgi:WD40 repeat protein
VHEPASSQGDLLVAGGYRAQEVPQLVIGKTEPGLATLVVWKLDRLGRDLKQRFATPYTFVRSGLCCTRAMRPHELTASSTIWTDSRKLIQTMSRLLFLSHSGIDTEAAKALKERILSTPEAREQGLRIWFDKDDMRVGEPWQRQIDEALEKSHAFAVYVGSKGSVNWVEAEVRVALQRAITEQDYRFIPIVAGTSCGPGTLPGFAKQFQGVFEVESRPGQFNKLLQAILGGAEAGCQELEAEPFLGLRAIDAGRSHLFFGRERETQDLVERVHRTALVLVTGDSGSGKSSLVGAGLVPRFRGGALALLDGTRPDDAIWHVVTTRPGNQPFRQLGDAVDEAAKALGLPLADRGALADWAASGEMDKARRGLRCDLPPEQVQVLLVVDQFEELLTITPPELRGPFIDFLLDLSDPQDERHRVVLTMRHDYVNLCSPFERLMGRLDADDRRVRLRLGRVTNDGLRRIVIEPLRLAGIDQAEGEALASQVLRDVGERPGDLALVQMALTETWQARHQHGGDLLRAYADIGRVEGALAQAAERVRTQVLDSDERTLLDSILLRLVRLGDTGGATRRVAIRGEFDDARWSLIQRLADKSGKRLVLIGGNTEEPTVEIAHEALVTAWPFFQNLLQEMAEEKRILDSLIPRTQRWAIRKDPGEREKRLATGADLELFMSLDARHPTWLSGREREFIAASTNAEKKTRQHEQRMTHALQGFAFVLLVALVGAGWMWWRTTQAEDSALKERDKATAAAKAAWANESHALAALSTVASNAHRYPDAVKLALAAWPRSGKGDRPKLQATIEALGTAQRFQKQMIPSLRHEDNVRGAVFNADETRILTWSVDGTARLWDTATGEAVLTLRHEDNVGGAVFSGDETRILTWSLDDTARVWDAATGEPLLTLRHESSAGKYDGVNGAVFNADETRILTWSDDDTARLWNAATGEAVLTLRHEGDVEGAVFNADETRILTWSVDSTAGLWDAATGEPLLTLRHDGVFTVNGAVFNADETRILTWSFAAQLWDATTGEPLLTLRHDEDRAVKGAVFNADETRILTWSGYDRWSGDGTARMWDAATGKSLLPPLRHDYSLNGAVFNADETRILTWSKDGTARLWNATTGEAVLTLRHQGNVGGAVFNADETRILTSSGDGTARLWDAVSGEAVLPFLRHEGIVNGAIFNADATRIVTWSVDETARLWDASTGEPLLVPLQHEGDVNGAVFNADETRILTWSGDDTARLWDAVTGEPLLPPLRHQDSVRGGVFNADETRILTWSWDGTIRLWDATTGEALLTLRHEDAVRGAVFNADETRILTWSKDGTARLWDAATGDELMPPLRHQDQVWGAIFNADETRILTWSLDNTARLWDATSGEPLLLPLQHEGDVNGAVFNADETRILTWAKDGTARLWDAASGKPLLTLRHDERRAGKRFFSYVSGAVFNADGTRILTWSSDSTARLWDADTGEAVLILRHENWVTGAVFSDDETRILTWSLDSTARLWDATTGEAVLPRLRHGGVVNGATFNANETRILTWAEDDTARLWDAATGEALLPPLRHERSVGNIINGVIGAVFNADGTRILTWSRDDTARLWDISRLPTGHLIEVACRMLPDHNTSELESRYGIAISEPICGPDTPAPVWARLED